MTYCELKSHFMHACSLQQIHYNALQEDTLGYDKWLFASCIRDKKREGSALAVKRTVDLVYPKWFSLTEFRGFGTKVSGSSTEFLLTQP